MWESGGRKINIQKGVGSVRESFQKEVEFSWQLPLRFRMETCSVQGWGRESDSGGGEIRTKCDLYLRKSYRKWDSESVRTKNKQEARK